MTIQEAIKSGKKFRREGEDELGWRRPYDHSDRLQSLFSPKEILATDWEIEPEVYRFKCHWPPQLTDYSSALVGKKVRVAVEVLGERCDEEAAWIDRNGDR